MSLSAMRADLHIHTCLSPCADDTMTPRAIVLRAKELRLDMIGVCDHNAAGNVAAARHAGEREGVCIVGGMEITTREEIHILGLFGTDAELQGMAELVGEHLGGRNDPDAFGFQVVVDEEDCPTGLDERLLIGATDLALEQVIQAIHGFGGLAIAAHVNRGAFSLTSQLGFVPPGLPLDAVELGAGTDAAAGVPGIGGLPVVRSSDAHYISDIGPRCTVLRLATPSFAELAMALRGEEGRGVEA